MTDAPTPPPPPDAPSPPPPPDTVTLGENLSTAAATGSVTSNSVDSRAKRSLIAYRGENWLLGKEAIIHLTYLMRLENIGVLLGAGASSEVGGHTMSEIWNDCASTLEESEKTFLISQKIAEESNFPFLEDSEKQICVPNVEALLDKLAISISLWERVDDPNLELGRKVRRTLYSHLIEASLLNEEWWKTQSGPDLSEAKLKDHREMLEKLSSIRQPGQPSPWVFTTNYDLAIEWAADSIDLNIINGFIGVHSRKFTPQSFDLGYRNVQARGEARFGTYNIYLAKLHGSLTWSQNPNGHFYEAQATESWKGIENFMHSSTDDLPFTVAPSAAKYMQTVGFLYGEMMRRFAEFTGRSQTVLFVSGYSFGDEHINRLLRSALLNPTLQLVIYVFDLKEEGDIDKLPKPIKDLIGTRSSRITIIGGSFKDFVSDLPDPVIYNDDMKEIRELVQRDGDPS